MIKERKIDGGFELYYSNGVPMGEVLMDVDGYYKYWPITTGGYWDEGSLTYVLEYLKEKNKEWDERINEFFQ